MLTTDELVKRIIEEARRPVNLDMDFAAGNIKHLITWHMDDVLKMVKNINETSLAGSDRINRVIEFESKYGVPKTHII